MTRPATALVGLLVTGLVLALGPSAGARDQTPRDRAGRVDPAVARVADRLGCVDLTLGPHSGGGPSRGGGCWVRSRGQSRRAQEFQVRNYRNPGRAVRYWRRWTAATWVGAEPGCFVRRGRVLVLPLGGGSGRDVDAYQADWCDWAAQRTRGRVVTGLP